MHGRCILCQAGYFGHRRPAPLSSRRRLTFKNNGRSDVYLSFRSQTNSNYHKLDVRGNGNEIPAQATIEVCEWV